MADRASAALGESSGITGRGRSVASLRVRGLLALFLREMKALQQERVHGDDDARPGHAERADGGAEREADGGEYAGGDGEREAVVTDGPAEVLVHLADGAMADADGCGDVERI